MTYQIGDQVEKFTGDYQLTGEVRAVFTTSASKVRYVVEHKPGFLHIYGDANLRPVNSGTLTNEGSTWPRPDGFGGELIGPQE